MGALTTDTKYPTIPNIIKCTMISGENGKIFNKTKAKIFPKIAPNTSIGRNIPPANPVAYDREVNNNLIKKTKDKKRIPCCKYGNDSTNSCPPPVTSGRTKHNKKEVLITNTTFIHLES